MTANILKERDFSRGDLLLRLKEKFSQLRKESWQKILYHSSKSSKMPFYSTFYRIPKLCEAEERRYCTKALKGGMISHKSHHFHFYIQGCKFGVESLKYRKPRIYIRSASSHWPKMKLGPSFPVWVNILYPKVKYHYTDAFKSRFLLLVSCTSWFCGTYGELNSG